MYCSGERDVWKGKSGHFKGTLIFRLCWKDKEYERISQMKRKAKRNLSQTKTPTNQQIKNIQRRNYYRGTLLWANYYDCLCVCIYFATISILIIRCPGKKGIKISSVMKFKSAPRTELIQGCQGPSREEPHGTGGPRNHEAWLRRNRKSTGNLDTWWPQFPQTGSWRNVQQSPTAHCTSDQTTRLPLRTLYLLSLDFKLGLRTD